MSADAAVAESASPDIDVSRSNNSCALRLCSNAIYAANECNNLLLQCDSATIWKSTAAAAAAANEERLRWKT